MKKSSGEQRAGLYFKVRDAWERNDVATVFSLAYDKGIEDARKRLVKELRGMKLPKELEKNYPYAKEYNKDITTALKVIKDLGHEG
jgi:hypothetical protein